MKIKRQPIFDKEETKRFKKLSNKLARRYLKSAIKYFFLGRIHTSKRYYSKTKSLLKNKKANNFPLDLVAFDGKKVAVYTVLFGNCDKIKHINFLSKYCDFYIFTDQVVPSDSGWVKKDYNFPPDINTNVLKNRYLKMHPHEIFPDYEYSIYLDAVIVIELDIFRLLSRLGSKKIGMFKHYAGVSCLYDEAERLKRIGKVDVEETNRMMKRYHNEGFPSNFGFFECTIIVQKINDKDNVMLMNCWWKEFTENVKRDQLSFMYSLWKCGFDDSYVASLGITFWVEPIVKGIAHNSNVNILEANK